MTIQAQLADGTVLEFPDGTDDAVIDKVVRQHVSPQPDPSIPFKSIPIPANMAAPGAENVDYGDVNGPVATFLRRIGKGAMLNYGDEIGGFVKGYVPALFNGKDESAEYARARDAYRSQDDAEGAANPVAAFLGDTTGQVATGALATAATGGTSLLPQLALGAAQGGVSAAGESKKSDASGLLEDASIGAGIGAGGTLAGYGIGKVLGKVISPSVRPEVKTLMDAGVTPTPGQIIGKGAAKIEDRLTSVPGLGNMISGAQTRALNQFNKAALNEASAKVGQSIDEIGREGVDALKTQFDDAYHAILPNLTWQADNTFKAELNNIAQMASELPEPQFKRFIQVVQDKVVKKLGQTGSVDGQTFKAMEESLGDIAKSYKAASDPDIRSLGDAFGEVLKSMRATLERVNPSSADTLKAINAGYARYAILRDAASRIGSDSGVFTPAQLLSAVRAADKSAGKGAFARGDALMQDIAEAGKSVLGAKYPDSGTVGRGLVAGPVTGAVAWANPTSLLGLAGGSLPYTKFGQKIVADLLTKRPDGAAGASSLVRTVAPILGRGLAPGLLGL